MSNSPDDPMKFDVRTIERNIKYETLTRKEVRQHIDALPDVAGKAVTLGEIEDKRVAERADVEAEAPPAPTAAVEPTE
jgi:hypothetical protein